MSSHLLKISKIWVVYTLILLILLKPVFAGFREPVWWYPVFFKPKIISWLRRSYHKTFSSIDWRNKGSYISYYSTGRMDFSRLITSIMSSLGTFKTWFLKEVDLFWIHKSFVYANIYLSFYFEGSHSNIRYLLVALKKDGNNVHFFDVLPHCASGEGRGAVKTQNWQKKNEEDVRKNDKKY